MNKSIIKRTSNHFNTMSLGLAIGAIAALLITPIAFEGAARTGAAVVGMVLIMFGGAFAKNSVGLSSSGESKNLASHALAVTLGGLTGLALPVMTGAGVLTP